MSINIANVATTDTFQKLLTTVNQLAYAVSNSVVTVGSNAAIGDAAVTGNIYSNSVVTNNIFITNSISIGNTVTVGNVVINTNSIFIGNSSSNVNINTTSISFANSTANLNIKIPTSTQISNGQYYLNANGNYSAVVIPTSISNNQVITTGTNAALIDSWSTSSYNAVEYIVSVKDNNANNFYASKIMLAHNVSGVFSTEYASLVSNSYLGSFSAVVAGGNVLMYFTPTSTNTTVKFVRIIV